MKRIFDIAPTRNFCIACAVWLVCGVPSSLPAQESKLTGITVLNPEVKREKREVRLSMTFDLTRLDMGTQRSVRFRPVIVQREGSRELQLAPVIVDGKIRSRVHKRQKTLTGVSVTDSAYLVMRRKNGERQQVEYRDTFAYDPWMLQAKLVLREEVTGCLECLHNSAEMPLLDILPPFRPQYATSFVAPPDEPKRRSLTRVARIQFRHDKYNIEPAYKNNRSELDTVIRSIEMVKRDRDMQITGIYITGYASPEGTMAYNQRLSQNRADALARYGQRSTQTDASLWHVEGRGEDWEGLRHEVLKLPRLLKRDKVLQIIDECGENKDRCEDRLRALTPPGIYRRLLGEVYGILRHNEYRIEYNVRHFSLEEAKTQIKTHPELLSASEMYAVATSYAEGSPEFNEAMLTAARLYPDRPATVVNAAYVYLLQDDVPSAIAMLERYPADHPDVLNALGVAYAKDGQYARAKATLQKAVQAGSTEAQTNLTQLQGVADDLLLDL